MKYHCELWITKPNEFLIEADSLEEAKKKVAKIAAEKMKEGEKKLFTHVFEKQYIAGCDAHPSKAEHKEIAAELTAVIKKIMKW